MALPFQEVEVAKTHLLINKSIPAIKIGQLAVDYRYNQRFKGIGSLMIELARGITEDIKNKGVSCRFITVDADTENNPTVVEFYLKNGFKLNEKYKKKTKVSMRLDLFADIEKENYI